MTIDPNSETGGTDDVSRRGVLPLNRRTYLKAGTAASFPLFGGNVTATDGESDSTGDGSITPTALRADYERAPNNLDPTGGPPRFFWQLSSSERDVTQTAYRILVAYSETALQIENGNVWDSGKVSSDTSTAIEYGGPSLDPDTTYYWAVRIWDGKGRTSPWSQSTFTTAISASQWEGDWISVKSPDSTSEIFGAGWTDYSYETEFTIDSNAASLVFRAADRDNCYMWQFALASYDAVNADQHILRAHIKEEGAYRLIDEIPVGDALAGAGEQNSVHVIVSGSEITTVVNGETVDNRTDETHSSGTIGFRQYGSEHAAYDAVHVSTSDGETMFTDEFADGQRDHFSRGTVQDNHLQIDGTGMGNAIVIPYVEVSEFTMEDPCPLLRRDFEIKKDVKRARMHVSGLGLYEPYVNGQRVGNHVLDPAQTNYTETTLYSTYDVTEQVVSGENAVGVALGHGRPGEPHERTDEAWETDNPVLRLQLNIEFVDGTETRITSDETWTAIEGPTRWDSLLAGQEFYDAREEREGWTSPEYDDAGWKSTVVTSGPPGEMAPQRVQPITVHETIEPVEMWEPEPGVYVYDLGQMIAGWAELTVDGERGSRVKLREGEKLRDDGTVEDVEFGAEFLWQEYVLNGEDEERWEPRFTYGGFRYVQIEEYPGEPSLDTISGKVVHTAVDEGETGEFVCSNDLINQLHKNTRWAMLNNLHGFHTDTPTWEKLGWTETNIELAETLSANFSMERFWEKFLQDCRDSQLDNGDIPHVVPNEGVAFGGWGGKNDPGWDAATVLTAWHAYQYTGDERLLEEHYESMKQYVAFVRRNAEGGTVVRTGLGDWASPAGANPPEGSAIVSTGCYYRSVEIVSKTADVLGYTNEASEYDALRQEIKTTFNDEFFDATNDIYSTGKADEYRQTSNLYPLAFDIVPESRRDAVAANLAHNVRETEDGHLNTGAHGLRHLLPVLSEHGYHDIAYTVATQTTYPSQGYWLQEANITALLEFWPLDARSRTHDFLGSIDEWFYQYLAGIRNPVKPGFKHIKLAPRPTNGLTAAAASIQTVRGVIASRWERVNTPSAAQTRDELTLNVTVPGNSTAIVEIPTLGGDNVRVRENEKTIWDNGNATRPKHPGVKSVTRDGDAVVVEVGSGEYHFNLEQLGN